MRFDAPATRRQPEPRASLKLGRQLSDKASSVDRVRGRSRCGSGRRYLTQFVSLTVRPSHYDPHRAPARGRREPHRPGDGGGTLSTWNFFGGARRGALAGAQQPASLPSPGGAAGFRHRRSATHDARGSPGGDSPRPEVGPLARREPQRTARRLGRRASRKATSTDAEGILRRSVGRWFLVGAEARYRRRGPEAALPAVDSFRPSLDLVPEHRDAACCSSSPLRSDRSGDPYPWPYP